MASSQTIVILGAGQQSKVIISMARSLGLSIEGVFDDRRELWGTELLGEKVLGPIDLATDTSADGAVVAIGDNVSQREVVARMNLPWLTLVHPTAWVDPSSSLGEGSVVLPQAGVSTDAAIGRHAILNLRSLVSHDCRLGDFVHVAPGAILAGEAQVGSGTLIGAGAIVAPRAICGFSYRAGRSPTASTLPSTAVAVPRVGQSCWHSPLPTSPASNRTTSPYSTSTTSSGS